MNFLMCRNVKIANQRKLKVNPQQFCIWSGGSFERIPKCSAETMP